jgi:hypothetical protein
MKLSFVNITLFFTLQNVSVISFLKRKCYEIGETRLIVLSAGSHFFLIAVSGRKACRDSDNINRLASPMVRVPNF